MWLSDCENDTNSVGGEPRVVAAGGGDETAQDRALIDVRIFRSECSRI
jgi:hypothetical protein